MVHICSVSFMSSMIAALLQTPQECRLVVEPWLRCREVEHVRIEAPYASKNTDGINLEARLHLSVDGLMDKFCLFSLFPFHRSIQGV